MKKFLKENTLGFIFLIIFFVTNNIILTLCAICLAIYGLMNHNVNRQYNKVFIPFGISILISFLINLVYLDTKETIRIIILLGLLFAFPINQFNKKNIYYYSLFILSFIVVSQLVYFFNIPLGVRFFETYFPYDVNDSPYSVDHLLRMSYTGQDYFTGRFGGLYRNPNQCSRYALIAFSLGLIAIKKTNIRKILPLFIISLASVLISGSRTSLVVWAIISLYFLYKRVDLKNIILPSLLIGVLIFLYTDFLDFICSSRAFLVEEGMKDSFSTKIEWFKTFFNHENNLKNLLIGHGSCLNVQQYGIPMLDSEWGMTFFAYGILGFICYIVSLVRLYKVASTNTKIIMINLLWILSSTVFQSFRMSILFILILSISFGNTNFRKPIYHH